MNFPISDRVSGLLAKAERLEELVEFTDYALDVFGGDLLAISRAPDALQPLLLAARELSDAEAIACANELIALVARRCDIEPRVVRELAATLNPHQA